MPLAVAAAGALLNTEKLSVPEYLACSKRNRFARSRRSTRYAPTRKRS